MQKSSVVFSYSRESKEARCKSRGRLLAVQRLTVDELYARFMVLCAGWLLEMRGASSRKWIGRTAAGGLFGIEISETWLGLV